MVLARLLYLAVFVFSQLQARTAIKKLTPQIPYYTTFDSITNLSLCICYVKPIKKALPFPLCFPDDKNSHRNETKLRRATDVKILRRRLMLIKEIQRPTLKTENYKVRRLDIPYLKRKRRMS